MVDQKITKALARRIAQSKGAPVSAVVFAAIDSDRFTLSSFAARAAQRNQAVRDQLGKVMARVQEWESQQGQTVPVAFRPDEAALLVTAPPALLETLAEDDAVRALDVEAA